MSTTVWAGHRAGTPGHRRLVLGLMAGGLANFSLMYYVQPLLPLLARHYQVSSADSAHALSATTLTMAFGLLLMGPLADRIGRVPLMRWSLLASGIIGVASAVIPSWEGLVIVRGLLGLSLAGFPVAALAYLREEVVAADHLRTNAAYIAGTALGGAVGRLLPGPLAELGGWPLASLVMSGITLSAGLALAVLLPKSRRFEPRRVGTRDILLGVVSAPRDPVVALLCVAAFVGNGTFVGVYNAIGFRLQAPPFSLGVAASLLYLAYPVGIAAPGIARRLAERTGRGWAAVVFFALLGLAVALISLPSFAAMFVGLGAVTFVFLGLHSLLSGWVVDRARRRGNGTAQASSAYLLAFYTGSTLAGAWATGLWAANGWGAVEVFGLVLCLVGVGAAALANSSDRDAVRGVAGLAEPEISDTTN